MKQWLSNLRYRTQIWMQGRYGNDELSFTLSCTALILIIIANCSEKLRILTPIALGLTGWACYRTLSRNIYKRRAENTKFQKLIGKVKGFFNRQKRRWQDRKTHVYFKCSCGKFIRVPKGLGNVEITCPQCGTKHQKRT